MLIVEVDDVVEVEVADEHSSGLTVNFKIGVNTWRYKGKQGVGSNLNLVPSLRIMRGTNSDILSPPF